MKRLAGEYEKKLGLTITLILFVFFVMTAAFILAAILITIFHMTGIMDYSPIIVAVGGLPIIRNTLLVIGLSILLGVALSSFISKKATKPITKLISATRQIAHGDFSVRVDSQGISELEELSRSFNTMARELASIETLRSDFINSFSHEFKTPIVSIQGFAELLHEGDISEAEQKEYLEIIISESKRLATLSTNVLNLSKYESTTILTEKTEYCLDEQIRKAVLILEPKWTEKDIEIDIELDAVTFNGSESLLQQVWINLITNAIKFSNQGGIIGIYLKDSDTAIEITIQDNGVGMDEVVINHIFDKFYRADKSRAEYGHGLGLAIVKRIVELCDGGIEVNSKPGEGSVFTVKLPKR